MHTATARLTRSHRAWDEPVGPGRAIGWATVSSTRPVTMACAAREDADGDVAEGAGAAWRLGPGTVRPARLAIAARGVRSRSWVAAVSGAGATVVATAMAAV